VMCPEVVEVRQNVLVMDFIGQDSEAAPRLKDTEGLSPDDWSRLYCDCILCMRRMMQDCGLVHGDLSEYNMLYHDGQLWIIDVSQSVEKGHPQALDFLKRDCVNINGFFSKKVNCPVLPVRQFFDFIVTKELRSPDGTRVASPDGDADFLEAALEAVEDGDDVGDEVFVQTWIPSTLDQMADRAFIEKEIEKRKAGEELLYDRLLADFIVDKKEDESDDDESEEEGDDKEQEAKAEKKGKKDKDDDDDSASESGEEAAVAGADGHKPEGMTKAEWKQKVKEDKRTAREDKIPKALKKKYRKAAARGR